MGKKFGFSDALSGAIMMHYYGPIIMIIVIILSAIFIWGYFKFAKPVNDEAKALGYGQFEAVRIDPMSGKKIPKAEIKTYNNDHLILKCANGETVTFKELKIYRDGIKSCIDDQGKISQKNIAQVQVYGDILIKELLGLEYKITEKNELYMTRITSSTFLHERSSKEFESDINAIIKDMYQKQNK